MAKHNVLEYKGYHTEVEFDSESFSLRGKIEGITDFVDFECENLGELEQEFHMAVDDYLDFCEEVGKTPEKEYKGTFNVRIDPKLHRKLAILSAKEGRSLNASVEEAIYEFVERAYSGKDYKHSTIVILASELKNNATYFNTQHQIQSCAKITPFRLSANMKVQYN